MRILLLVILTFFTVASAVGQNPIAMEITTDKLQYEYGDSITVHITLTNEADSSYSIWGSTSCIVRMEFNNVEFEVICTADDREFPFPPGHSRTWTWYLNPPDLGIPDQDGIQTIRGWSERTGLSDSIQVQAPKFYGGRLFVGTDANTSKSYLDSLRNRVNAEVIDRYSPHYEIWQVKGHSIDSIAIAHKDDDELRSIGPRRPLEISTTSVSAREYPDIEIPAGFSLDQNYPNPFNPTTQISFEIPHNAFVRLEVFDLLGRQIEVLTESFMPAGRHEVSFDASGLSSGIYLYRLQTPEHIITRRMMLIK